MLTRWFIGLLMFGAILAQQVPEWIYHIKAPMLSSLTFADLDGDSEAEVIATTYGRGPNPYDRGIIFAWEMNGDSLPGWPVEVTTGPIPSTPVIGDLDGDGTNELVVGNWAQLFVFRANGSSYPGWPKSYGAYYSPTLEDLDGDDDFEIIYPSGSNIYVFQHDGSIVSGFPVSVPHDNAGTPAVADIDGDSLYEIVSGICRGPVTSGQFELFAWNDDGSVIPGFPVLLCGIIKSCPALGDLDNDGSIEIIVNAYHHSDNMDTLYVLDGNGNNKPGWPQCVPACRMIPPTLGDLDGDGDLEIIQASGYSISPSIPSKIHAFHHDGNVVENWPVILGNIAGGNSSTVIADIDGDTTRLEILVKYQDWIYGYHADASPIVGFPYQLDDSAHSGTYSPAPAIGDMDHDSDVEYVFASCYGEIHFFDETAPFDEDFAFWPMYKHEERNTSYYPRSGVPGVGENPEQQPLFLKIWPNPFQDKINIRLSIGHSTKALAIRIFDASGRIVRTLSLGTTTITWDGRDDASKKLPNGIYFLRFEAGDIKGTRKILLTK